MSARAMPWSTLMAFKMLSGALASQRRCPGHSLASTEDGVSPLEQESFSKFYLNFVWKKKKGGFATKDQKKGGNPPVYTVELAAFIQLTSSFTSPAINRADALGFSIVHGSSWRLTSPWCRLPFS